MPESVHIDYSELDELVITMLNLPKDYDTEDVEFAIFEKWGLGYEDFSSIVSLLVPLADSGKSSITGNEYRGFSKPEGPGRGWLIKVELKPSPGGEGGQRPDEAKEGQS